MTYISQKIAFASDIPKKLFLAVLAIVGMKGLIDSI